MNLQTHQYLSEVIEILSKWRRTIRITRRDLELSKTVVYLLNYIFIERGTTSQFQTIKHSPGDIVMKPELYNDKEEKIKQREYSYAERYVGVQIAPNGQMKTEYSFRLAQALEL